MTPNTALTFMPKEVAFPRAAGWPRLGARGVGGRPRYNAEVDAAHEAGAEEVGDELPQRSEHRHGFAAALRPGFAPADAGEVHDDATMRTVVSVSSGCAPRRCASTTFLRGVPRVAGLAFAAACGPYWDR